MADTPTEQLQMEFPCDFAFKAFGPNGPEFAERVRQAVAGTVDVSMDALKVRPSSQGKYQCVTVLVLLHSKQQLHAIYAALRKVEGLVYLV
ncbi:hypothetical protein DESUT3_19050 [Desulfuromonas versatilis]|uniref:Uncharacterized protein n=1 Tax=Desulfuromonas versatilis TaxID=2802975 RepID=A0ABM8HS80_9BACT|nr:DUF493 domain-containing protein [Desulfuromonas versatilis]BCR04836.1 hypothetical protein DESUT3_19050 [Desulfuromonas versatilis]